MSTNSEDHSQANYSKSTQYHRYFISPDQLTQANQSKLKWHHRRFSNDSKPNLVSVGP
jgi:hypothetical protein